MCAYFMFSPFNPLHIPTLSVIYARTSRTRRASVTSRAYGIEHAFYYIQLCRLCVGENSRPRGPWLWHYMSCRRGARNGRAGGSATARARAGGRAARARTLTLEYIYAARGARERVRAGRVSHGTGTGTGTCHQRGGHLHTFHVKR